MFFKRCLFLKASPVLDAINICLWQTATFVADCIQLLPRLREWLFEKLNVFKRCLFLKASPVLDAINICLWQTATFVADCIQLLPRLRE